MWYEGNVHDTDAKSVTMPIGDSGALGNKEGRATLVGRYTCVKKQFVGDSGALGYKERRATFVGWQEGLKKLGPSSMYNGVQTSPKHVRSESRRD